MKKIKHHCVTCKKLDHKVEYQKMADLPDIRLSPHTPPFFYTSCDYFGPYFVKISRKVKTKVYGVIFTCMNTRAVHLELAVDASTEEFLQVLRRFFCLRGCPSLILSDNGTQMVGAERQLKMMMKDWNRNKISDYCGIKGTQWKFTTPGSPHQNGVSEALVKSCKRAIRLSIGEQVLKPFEFYTYLVEVANLINQRPIGRHPTDPSDDRYLCPNDILLGRATPEAPPGPFREATTSDRYHFVQKLIKSFWDRWSRDILPNLFVRKKWEKTQPNLVIGDIVVMSDQNAIRGKWSLGKVTNVFPGKDSLVRNVEIKTSSGTFRRPITKLAIIHKVNENE